MKIPKHITDALGRPRCVCPVCGASAEITAKGTIARHRARLDPFAAVCAWSGQTAPEGAALEWLRREMEGQREDAASAARSAERCAAMAVELEKVIARESGK